MADRLIQIVVPVDAEERLRKALADAEGVDSWHDYSGAVRVFALQVSAEQVDTVLDPIQDAFESAKGFHAFVLPVEASLPRREEPEKTETGESTDGKESGASPSRVSREELYSDLSEHARVTRVYLAMVVLSTIVAAVGLSRNNAAIVIGAMVMAPLLGPNMALSLATALGDTKLAAHALRANVTGVLLAMVVASACGWLLDFDPKASEIVSRTFVGPTDLLVALAAGVAGALAFTSGVPSSLVGVMVAVALLPPLVVCLMQLTAGRVSEALGALLLLLCNVVSINLAGVGTFLVQGVSPRNWWDAERSKRISRRALAVWITLLVVVGVLILLSSWSREL